MNLTPYLHMLWLGIPIRVRHTVLLGGVGFMSTRIRTIIRQEVVLVGLMFGTI